MDTLNLLESSLLTKNVDTIPETYHDDIDVKTLKSEFDLFKEKLSHTSDAVKALKNMHPVRDGTCIVIMLIKSLYTRMFTCTTVHTHVHV